MMIVYIYLWGLGRLSIPVPVYTILLSTVLIITFRSICRVILFNRMDQLQRCLHKGMLLKRCRVSIVS